MKKLGEITLKDIQNYLRKHDCDEVITTKLVEKNNTETLQVFEFDGLYDDTIWVCSIYKNEDNDFYIKTATIYEGELLKNNGLIEKIYTTDTILTNLESPKIELVTMCRWI